MPIDAGKIGSTVLDAFGIALDNIPIVGTVKSLLSAIGLNVKGKTKHISAPQAYQVADAVAYQNFTAILQAGGEELVNAVGQEYPAFLGNLISSNNYWGGYASSIQGQEIYQYTVDWSKSNDMLQRARAMAFNHVVWVARNVDADRFEDDFSNFYKAQMSILYGIIRDKYKVDVSNTGAVVSGKSSSSSSSFLLPLLGAGILLAILAAKKKR